MAEKRQVAHKMRIGDMLNGNIIYNGDRFSALEALNKRISRVNLICNIVDKYSNPEKSYNSITVDDGTGQIKVKAFSDSSILLENLEIGDTVRIVGWLRFYNDEIYVAPEIALRMDPKWGYVRKLELIKEYGEFKDQAIEVSQVKQPAAPVQQEEEIIVKEKVLDEESQSPKAVILKKIKENKEGIDIEQLILALKFPVNEIHEFISSLIADGEIYEPRPGYLRSLD